MAVFRIEKTRDYTVMSNHHLRDMSLSLKAKGLLSLMLSLPENWDYTMKGLARICKDGIDSISGGIRELEEHGYLIRERVRGANGQLGSIEYTILEQPKEPTPAQEKPIRENPVQVKLFLLNLPYLLFVYPFDKLAQAFRLAPGSDLSGKLLSIGDGFTTALSSPWLSFHPTDLLIGIAGAVILRMAVYLKGKNAKKYRHGIEYGSARWSA